MERTFKYGSPGKTGAVGELIVALDLMKRGYNVFRALAPSCPCDLIALKDARCLRVEATTGYRGKDKITFAPHKLENYDVIVVVIDDSIHYFPELP